MAVNPVQNLTNPMPAFEGRTPGLDANGRIPFLAWYPRVVAKTAAYTVLPEESGTIFTTTGATAAVTFTLPAISDGPFVFFFANGADQTMTITAETADTLVVFNNLAADSVGYATASEKIGGGFMVFSDGTNLFALGMPGASHGQTITVTDA